MSKIPPAPAGFTEDVTPEMVAGTQPIPAPPPGFTEDVAAPANDQPGHASGIARTLAQGASFGFSDEAEALVRSWWSDDKSYEENLKTVRGSIKKYSKANPGLSTAAELVGAFAMPGALGLKVAQKTYQGANLAGKALIGATVGTTEAGLAGFGSGEGGVDKRLERAKATAPYGAVLGGGAPLAAPLVGKAAKFVKNRLPGRNTHAAQDMMLDAVRRDAADHAPTATQRLEQGLSPVDPTNVRATAQAELTRLYPPAGSATSTGVAAQRANDNVRSLAKKAIETSGAARRTMRDVVDAARSGSAARIDDAVRKLLPDGVKDFNTYVGLKAAQRSKDADVAFDALRARPPVDAAELAPFAQRPTFKKAWTMANVWRRDAGMKSANLSALTEGGTVDPDFLIKLKKALDDQRKVAFRSGASERGVAVRGLHDEVLGAIDDMLPAQAGARGYQATRNAFRTASSEVDALKQGRNLVLNEGDKLDDVMDSFRGMQDADKELFMLGVMQSVRDRVANNRDGARWLMTQFEKPAFKGAFDEILGSGTFPSKLRSQVAAGRTHGIEPSMAERNMKFDNATSQFRKEADLAAGTSELSKMTKASRPSESSRVARSLRELRTPGGIAAAALKFTEPMTPKRADVLAKMLGETAPAAQRKIRQELMSRWDTLDARRRREFVQQLAQSAGVTLSLEAD